jgi:hypothetical protein
MRHGQRGDRAAVRWLNASFDVVRPARSMPSAAFELRSMADKDINFEIIASTPSFDDGRSISQSTLG